MLRHQTSRDPEGIHLERWDARMRNWKLCNFRHSGAFSPEVMLSNVTRPLRSCAICVQTSPVELPLKIWERACAIGSALGVLSRTSGSYNLIIFYELALSLVFCPFPAIFSWGMLSIITQPFFRVFSDMFEVLCSTPMMFSTTSAFSLWYFY